MSNQKSQCRKAPILPSVYLATGEQYLSAKGKKGTISTIFSVDTLLCMAPDIGKSALSASVQP
jgi:hypothetical protein